MQSGGIHAVEIDEVLRKIEHELGLSETRLTLS